ncbi:MAG TPA: hypothetical protein VFI90_02460, partial [Rubrobacter sp.]|nr:hypothetical protein [Rubrobacter sp.]
MFAFLTLLAGLGMTASQTERGLAQTADPRPNILFILADDMRASDLKYMPKTQYPHNHHVWVNVPPSGGFWNFYDQGLENSTVATWL